MFFSDEINKNNKNDIKDIKSFLNKHEVEYDFPEKTFVIRDKGKIISTGSVDENVLKYFFTDEEYKGQGTVAIIYNSLLDHLVNKGYDSYFVFTGPKNKIIFESLGLEEVYKTEDVSLLEGGFYNYDKWIKKVKKQLAAKKGSRGAIVMNCNPMTMGHKYLIEKALEEVEDLIIFLVEEDKSVFSIGDRWEILKNELGEDERIRIIKSGPYIISRATFPTYFLKEKDDKLDIYTKLDSGIFGEKIAKDLEIDKRFLGTEPIDQVTKAYNDNIIDALEAFGVSVRVIDRKKMDKEVISASKIRKLLKDGYVEKAYKYLPKATIDYLKSKRGKDTIENL